jgi:hypothetical protein
VRDPQETGGKHEQEVAEQEDEDSGNLKIFHRIAKSALLRPTSARPALQ